MLRALEAVGVRLDTGTDAVNKSRKDGATPKVDIDAIVNSARKGRR